MKFTLDSTSVPVIETACLVIGVFSKTALQGSAELIDQASNGALQKLIDSSDIDTSLKSTTLLHGLNGVAAKRILVMGCGEAEKLTAVRYDSVCKSAGAFLRDHAVTSAHICLNDLATGDLSDHWCLRQSAVNVAWSNYLYTATKAPKDGNK